MRLFRYSIITAIISTTFFSSNALAAAFELYEMGTPIVGTADVGQAAVAEDASTTYFNPAGMVQLQNSQFLLGTQILLPYMNFKKNSFNTFSGDNGGNAGTLTPGIGMYYVYSYNNCLKFGVSLTTPYGGSLTYDDGWVGRYNVQNVFFYTFNLNPSVAFRVNNWLDVGVGLVAEYINLQQTVAIPLTDLVDGQINVKVHNLSGGYNFGAMATPTPTTKIGLAYRSQVVHTMHGNLTFLRLSDTPAVTTGLTTPQNLILSLSQGINQFNLLAELGWANWASMQNTILHVSRYALTTPLDWRNTYRVGLGGQYHVTPGLTLQTGVSYDSSPTNASHRLPVLPMDRQWRFGAGAMYDLMHAVTLGLSYEYINFGKADINSTSRIGVLAGDYSRNWANVVQISLNVAT